MGRGNKYSVQGCKTARELERAVTHQGGVIEHGGRHDIVRDPDGNGGVAIPRHNGDLATGTRSSIVKALIAIGFTLFGLLCVVLYAIVTAP